MDLTLEEQLKVLFVRMHVSASEVARRIGQTPQNFNGKLKRGSFSYEELEKIAEVLDCKFERTFVLPSGERI